MNPFFKLAIPIVLGLTAAGVNWLFMREKPVPQYYARMRADLNRGDPFKDGLLERFPVDSEYVTYMPKTAVPYEQRETLFGREATRDLKKGDMILWQDSSHPGWEFNLQENEKALPISLEGISSVPKLLRVNDYISFLVAQGPEKPKGNTQPDVKVELVGPFRVLSVGDRVSRDSQERKTEGRVTDERMITVAVRIDDPQKIDDKIRKVVTARGFDRRLVGLVLSPIKKK